MEEGGDGTHEDRPSLMRGGGGEEEGPAPARAASVSWSRGRLGTTGADGVPSGEVPVACGGGGALRGLGVRIRMTHDEAASNG